MLLFRNILSPDFHGGGALGFRGVTAVLVTDLPTEISSMDSRTNKKSHRLEHVASNITRQDEVRNEREEAILHSKHKDSLIRCANQGL